MMMKGLYMARPVRFARGAEASRRNILLAFLLALLWRPACTHNPLSKDPAIFSPAIQGRITLSDYADPQNIYVWLAGAGVSTRTAADGAFALPLPAPGTQPGKGLNGEYALYFYCANYRLDSLMVLFQDGEALLGQAGLDQNGFLTRTIKLIRLLDIEIVLDKTMLSARRADTLMASVYIQADEQAYTVRGYFSKPLFKGDAAFTAGFVYNDKLVRRVLQPDRLYAYAPFTVDQEKKALLPIRLCVAPAELPAGEYEIIPYLLIAQQNLPADLLRSMGSHVEEFHPDHTLIPVQVRGNRFKVVP